MNTKSYDGGDQRRSAFYVDRIKKDLGKLRQYIPEDGIYHDPNAYLKSGMENRQKKAWTA